ncbi:MAG: ribonuclease HII [Candidatus Methylopumilus sp.]|jgi:ribonuclease HII|nr:ribonuclease HII [Candidatus Methylopumilus sp.]NBW60669.1 ribonuclease HII [Methylophilaceae bacterium]
MSTILIAGVDEAGRGPLAGAVYAAAVILDPQRPIEGLADSKTISEKKREQLSVNIKQSALAWAIASASAEEIDNINILQASLLAMKRAIEQLQPAPEKILVDGLYLPDIAIQGEAVIKGDSKHACISAASILAKVARDEELYRLDSIFPDYGFALHKGYPTKLHIEKIQQHGVLPIHRKTFGPVKKLLQAKSIT